MKSAVLILAAWLLVPSSHAALLSWEDPFSAQEQAKLQGWIEQADAGMERLFGPWPFHYRAYLHRSPSAHEPVPWAQTNKRLGRDVHFYVDPRFPLTDFVEDWTATHELVHLMFPYLGESGRWFAEGIASYFQFPAMVAAGSLDWRQASGRLSERLRRAERLHREDGRPIVSLSQFPSGRLANVRLYWGGAAYFLRVDQRLQAELGRRLNTVIQDYLACCSSRRGGSVLGMIQRLDQISDSEVFSRTYLETVAEPGFPAFASALAWFSESPMPMAPPSSRSASEGGKSGKNEG